MSLPIVPDQRTRPLPIRAARRISHPHVWAATRLPYQPASVVRAMFPPRGINPVNVLPGDRVSSWVITEREISKVVGSHHSQGSCRCVFGACLVVGCTPETPICPCHIPVSYESYRFTCRCDCGTVRVVATSGLMHGESLSCGSCIPVLRKGSLLALSGVI